MLECEIEFLLECQTLRHIFCGRAKLSLPLFDARKRLLDPTKIFFPLVDVREQRRQVPFVGVANVSACWNLGSHQGKLNLLHSLNSSTSQPLNFLIAG